LRVTNRYALSVALSIQPSRSILFVPAIDAVAWRRLGDLCHAVGRSVLSRAYDRIWRTERVGW
jgi:hypothetical protein